MWWMCTGDWLSPVISNTTFKKNVEAYIKKPIANKDLNVYLWKMENKWLGEKKVFWRMQHNWNLSDVRLII